MKKQETKDAEAMAAQLASGAAQLGADAINTVSKMLGVLFPSLSREKRRNLAARAVQQKAKKL
jgi:hypothetical protein